MATAPRIIIDPGHGGSERAGNSSAYGARGPRGVIEKDVTLDIAEHVVARLGGAAALTRKGDRNLTIGARAARGQRSDVFVSIHANYGAPELWGPEVYVHPEAGHGSRALAGHIARALDRQAGRYGGGASERRAAMAVLNPSAIGTTAACLVEVDYLSNARGERRLGDPGARAAIGAAIASAIQQHLASDRQPEPSSSRAVDSGSLTLEPGVPGHVPLLLTSAHNGGTLGLEGTITWNAGARPHAITARFTDLASQGIAGTEHAVRLPTDLDVAIPITAAGNEPLRWLVPVNPGPARIELTMDSTDPQTRVRIDWRAVVSRPGNDAGQELPAPRPEGLSDPTRYRDSPAAGFVRVHVNAQDFVDLPADDTNAMYVDNDIVNFAIQPVPVTLEIDRQPLTLYYRDGAELRIPTLSSITDDFDDGTYLTYIAGTRLVRCDRTFQPMYNAYTTPRLHWLKRALHDKVRELAAQQLEMAQVIAAFSTILSRYSTLSGTASWARRASGRL